MKLADFVQKQNAAMRAGDSAFLRLRHAIDAKLSCSLIDRIVNAADERIGDGAFVEADTCRVHFDKRSIFAEGRFAHFAGFLKDQSCGAGFADARRTIDNDMLRIAGAKDGPQRLNAFFLTDDVFHAGRADALVERLGEMNPAHLAEAVHILPAAAVLCRKRTVLRLELAIKINAHNESDAQLNERQNSKKQTVFLLCVR